MLYNLSAMTLAMQLNGDERSPLGLELGLVFLSLIISRRLGQLVQIVGGLYPPATKMFKNQENKRWFDASWKKLLVVFNLFSLLPP